MRATLNLDPDVVRRVEQEVQGRGLSFEAVVNDGLRKGLGPSPVRTVEKRFEVKPLNLRLRAEVDPQRLTALAEQLELEASLSKLR